MSRRTAVWPATATTTANHQHQNHQQQTPPPLQRQYYQSQPWYHPPTPTLPLPDSTRHHSVTTVPLTHSPSSRAQRRSPSTPHPSPQPPQQSHRHQQTLQIIQGQRASIPYRPHCTATPPSTPPLTDLPSQSTVRTPSTGGPQSTKTHEPRNAYEGRDGRHPQQTSEPTMPWVQAEEFVDDAELLDTILDGMGRMVVGTVAMQKDEAGRWRIRRDLRSQSTE
ncbi:hypothetical protein LZ32DRAFT_146854 [Colletotrichum eremochloae]|nr:hypothetical protein LZ32DRAFT_146854 [Colletotrichum eremochloae]